MIKFIKNDLLIEEFQIMQLKAEKQPNLEDLILPLPDIQVIADELQ